MNFRLAFCICLALMALSPVYALMPDYTPIVPADRKKQVRLNASGGSAQLVEGKEVSAGSYKLRLVDDDLQISSTSLKQNWTIVKRYFGLGTTIFEADLDKNGKRDLVLLQCTGACGIAPPTVLTIILTAKDGRPQPYEFSTYSQLLSPHVASTAHAFGKIDDILDLDGDGNAEIVTEELDYADVRGKTRSYWRTVIYSAKAGKLVRNQTYRGLPTPLLVAYKYKPNHVVERKPHADLLVFDNVSHSAKVEEGIISAVDKNDTAFIRQLKITTGKHVSDWLINQEKDTLTPFVQVSSKDGNKLLALDTVAAAKLIEELQHTGKPVGYVPRSLKGYIPLQFFVRE